MLACMRDVQPNSIATQSIAFPKLQYQNCMFTVKSESADEFVEQVNKLKPSS